MKKMSLGVKKKNNSLRDRFGLCLVPLWLIWLWSPIAQAGIPHHSLEVTLSPATGHIHAIDRIRLPGPQHGQTQQLSLHANLRIEHIEGGRVTHESDRPNTLPALKRYTIEVADGAPYLSVEYSGRIQHGVAKASALTGIPASAGHIGTQGVYLSPGSHWYPDTGSDKLSFDLRVKLPTGWSSVSQGINQSRDGSDHWRELQAQESIFLVAAPFSRYVREHDGLSLQVYLRRPDAALAKRYLDVTAHYLDLYQGLLGDYPYAKFALVENFWETGYGMPSFTLLGPRVIRLPFILHSSYPHEILHNWWGNGVYPDWRKGNWSEGLTAYLADHLIKEGRGQGADYRRAALRKYRDYVRSANDFPLSQFRARHGEASQAIGYNKALMLFHMLRLRLGDQAFVRGLRHFWRKHRFHTADYGDLRQSFEQSSGLNLSAYFEQWIGRSGAPELRLQDVSVARSGDGYSLTGGLEQVQAEPPFVLSVPVWVAMENGEIFETTLDMAGRQLALKLELPSSPLALRVDPRFDLFRRLHPDELPTALGELFGAGQLLLVLPSRAEPALLEAYEQLAKAWRDRHPEWRVLMDNELARLPADGPVFLLGRTNLHARSRFAQSPEAFVRDHRVPLEGGIVPNQDTSLVLTHPRRRGTGVIAWLAAASPMAATGLARKLPHYSRYSYLVFEGPAPTNRVKGQWPLQQSPLLKTFGAGDATPGPQPRPALTALGKTSSAQAH